jgi:hypothetical protein
MGGEQTMIQAAKEGVGAVVLSGPREGEVVLLDPEVVSQAPEAEDGAALAILNEALDTLNASLDRLVTSINRSADDYLAAAERMERGL